MDDLRKIKLSPRTEGFLIAAFGTIFLLELLGIFSVGFKIFLLLLAGLIIFVGLDRAHVLHAIFRFFKKK